MSCTPKSPAADRVRAVVADLAGTTVDYGSCAPAGVFVEVFRRAGVEVSVAEARGPMGMGKKDHLRELLRLPRVAADWLRAKGREWNENDIEGLYQEFIPLQMGCLPDYGDLIPGCREMVEALRGMGVRFGVTTGYTLDMTRIVLDCMADQDVVPEAFSCLSSVSAGRPAPWMIFDVMEQLDVFPPAAVVAVGDTIADIQAGRNAGVWTVGVTRTGNLVGRSEKEAAAADPVTLRQEIARATETMYANGADYVVEGIAELPAVLEAITARLLNGERP
jgi:phosphonoacetaldehyde hydrolase